MSRKGSVEKIYQIENSEIKVSRRTLNRDFHLHTHDFYEIEFIFSGCATHRINDYVYGIKKGDIYLLNGINQL